ncbi:putative mitochondrial protein, partial [Mucuna pruriens]
MMMNEFAITNLGKMRYFLGIEVLQVCNGIFIGQKKYIKEMLDRFNMLDCNLVKNPIVPSIKLLKIDQGVEVDSILFKQLVGSLMYLTTTRPDIAHFLRQGTQNLGIFYKDGGNEELLAYTNSKSLSL